MTEADLRERLLAEPAPDDVEAGQRSWEVVSAAYQGRELVPRARNLRPVLVLAALAVLVGVAVSPPGRSVAGWIRDRVAAEEESGPPLARLPAPGRVLVTSAQGAWVVHADGSKRFVGAYEEASWSPSGLYVIAARGRHLTAVQPEDGVVRWSLSREGRVSQPRWAPSGLRIAYRSGDSLRVVDGNGTDDRLLVQRAGPAAPAWRPGRFDVLAYEDERGRVHLRDVTTGADRWRSRPLREIRELMWSPDGARLVVLSGDRRLDVFSGEGKLMRTWEPKSGAIVRAAFAPAERSLALTLYDVDAEVGRGSVYLLNIAAGRARRLTSVRGSIEDVVWSPDGRWLLAGWSAADQWLFLRLPGVSRIVDASNITREFDPGGLGEGAFPRIAGWAPPVSG